MQYVDNLIHSCSCMPEKSHYIAHCPDRNAIGLKFLDKWEKKQWSPFDEIKQGGEEKAGRGRLGAIDYVKKRT